jgi:hypothetical protein
MTYCVQAKKISAAIGMFAFLKFAKMPTHIAISDWYFEKKSYAEQRDVDRIEEALTEPVYKWLEATEKILRRHLSANPTQKSAAQAYGSRLVMDGLSAACLFFLIISRDNPNPEQCIIFVGSEEWIMRKSADLMAQLQAQLSKPGTQGVVLEQNL